MYEEKVSFNTKLFLLINNTKILHIFSYVYFVKLHIYVHKCIIDNQIIVDGKVFQFLKVFMYLLSMFRIIEFSLKNLYIV